MRLMGQIGLIGLMRNVGHPEKVKSRTKDEGRRRLENSLLRCAGGRLQLAVVGAGGLEVDDGFAGLGVAQAFAGEAFDGFGGRVRIAQSIDGSLELTGVFFFQADLVIAAQDLFPHALVLLDQGKVPDTDTEKDRDDDEN